MPTNRNMVSKMKAIGVAILAAVGIAAGAFDRYKAGGIVDGPRHASSQYPRHIFNPRGPMNLDARY